MIRLAAAIFSLILCFNGSLANTECADGNETEELATMCGSYCFSAMKPVLGYLKTKETSLDTCENGSRQDLSQMNTKLADMQKTLDTVKKSQQDKDALKNTLTQHLPANLSKRLEDIENKLAAELNEKKIIQNQLKEIQDILTKVARTGLMSYYINEKAFDENSNNTCQKMGGHLVSVQTNNNNNQLRSLN
ncbi:uncharacterized protein [Drosophila kikkawai]|uniref:Uncharacterized protein n=1 Tax=Drosophila kikkawai TaxID=30033 RepID=A0A6P4JFR8_DROKI|nr:uncharacterized protein LOC108082672 [Drosophila kikkawai]